MSTWAWAGVGVGAFFLIGTLASLVVAAVLGRISREAADIFEAELWARVPLGRERVEAATKTVSTMHRRRRHRVGGRL